MRKSNHTLKVIGWLCLLSCASSINAGEVINLYGSQPPPYFKPNELSEYEADCWGARCVYDVVNPTLTLFKPTSNANRSAVVIMAGGGYETQAIYHEGYDVAKKLAEQGTLAVVLKYRLPNPKSATKPELVPITDVRKAIALIRRRHHDLNIDQDKIGVMGFSAGSHLTTVASVNFSDNVDENPNFSLLIYGVTRFNEENHNWLEKTLYHRPLTPVEQAQNKLLARVSTKTPPAFLVHAIDDETCHYTESTLYAEALASHSVPVELHLFATGGHGFGLGHSEHGTQQWIELANNWLNRLSSQ